MVQVEEKAFPAEGPHEERCGNAQQATWPKQ